MQLYITTYGAFLHIKDGMFQVKYTEDGQEIKKKIPPKKVSAIVLDRGTSLTYEAVKTALTHNIDIVFAEGDGAPIGRVWHSKLGSTTKIRKRQLEASMNAEAIPWVKKWILDKINNQIDFIKDLKKHRKAKEEHLKKGHLKKGHCQGKYTSPSCFLQFFYVYEFLFLLNNLPCRQPVYMISYGFTCWQPDTLSGLFPAYGQEL